MDVRICPQCGAENKRSYSSCSKCRTSLASVPATTGRETAVATAVSETQPQPQAPPPGGPPVTGLGSSYFSERPQPVKKGSGGWVGMLIFALVLGAVGVGAWMYINRPLPPEQVMQRIFDASKAGDYEKLKPHITRASIDLLVAQHGGEENLARQMKSEANGSGVADLLKADTSIKGVRMEGEDKAIAQVELPDDSVQQFKALTGAELKVEFVLLREERHWKMDLPQTEDRMIDQLNTVMRAKFGPSFDIRKMMPQRPGPQPPGR